MSPAAVYRRLFFLVLLIAPLAAGCTVRGTIPARCFPSAVNYSPRSTQEPINFIHLRQDPPDVYMLGPRDILGIYIEGVLGQSDEAPPVHSPQKGDLPPAIGFPMPVRDDGTLSLPLVPPLDVAGLSLAQTEQAIREAYTVAHDILKPGRDRIIVTLIRPRTYQVLVVREDTTAPAFRASGGEGEMILGSGKRGATYAIELPAYENDVLHALSESGGLPGLDAKNEITILRGGFNAKNGSGVALAPLRRVGNPANDSDVVPASLERDTGPAKDSGVVLASLEQDAGPANDSDVLPASLKQDSDPANLSDAVLASLRGGDARAKKSEVVPASVTQELKLAKVGPEPPTLAPDVPELVPNMPGFAPKMPGLVPDASSFRYGYQTRDSDRNVLKIPLRSRPEDPPLDLAEEDIILNTGDIVFIESRDAEVFYTGGLIQGGQFPIPRDYDLDVLGAIAMAGGSVATGAGSGTVRGSFGGGFGIGTPFPPTRAIVLRTVNGRQVSIRVNLRQAMRNPRERILIQPNDFIMLEYTPVEFALNLVLSQVQLNYFLNNFGR